MTTALPSYTTSRDVTQRLVPASLPRRHDATTVRLFDAVVSRLRERQSKVLVTGIDTEQQLGVALKAGAELFQGSHLAPPALVGSIIFGEAPLSLAEKLPLFG